MQALKGLELSVPRGRIFGLLGPNGAGKTTLAKLLLGIAFPTRGSAAVLGRPPGDLGSLARIGYLPEGHRYPPHLTGTQVLIHFARLSGIPAAGRAARVAALLRRVGLQEWGGMRAQRYSKGMLQRIGLAQALLNEPDLLILDEPTDGVDPLGRRAIRDLLLQEKERGATIFLSSHLLSEVERLCDRVAILKDGTLLREGSVEDLTRSKGTTRLEVRGLPPDSLPRLAAIAPVVQTAAGRLEVATADPAPLNALLDAVRAAGGLIVSVVPHRESLEEAFVEIVADEAPPAPPAGGTA
ncbi:MAG: ATP-binding cassette domain-containing protein [Candidatus Polarisedimenticolia bacterium]